MTAMSTRHTHTHDAHTRDAHTYELYRYNDESGKERP